MYNRHFFINRANRHTR